MLVLLATTVSKVRELLAQGVNPNSTKPSGETALHKACSWGKVDMCEVLLAAGADPNKRDSRGRTPMHEACANGKIEAARVMLAYRPNLSIKDKRGKTAMDVIGSSNRTQLKALLANPDAVLAAIPSATVTTTTTTTTTVVPVPTAQAAPGAYMPQAQGYPPQPVGAVNYPPQAGQQMPPPHPQQQPGAPPPYDAIHQGSTPVPVAGPAGGQAPYAQPGAPAAANGQVYYSQPNYPPALPVAGDGYVILDDNGGAAAGAPAPAAGQAHPAPPVAYPPQG